MKPLESGACWMSSDTTSSADVLGRIRFMSLLPTAECNFSCRYCYASAFHSRSRLSERQIVGSVDFFLGPSRTDLKGHSITILGGGEPLCRPELVQTAVRAIRDRERRYDRAVDIVLVTNGSLLDERFAGFLVDRDVHVRFSFEVLKDVQESNRGDFGSVDKALRGFLSMGGRASIRTVVTPGSAGRMPDMVRTVAERYRGVSEINCDIVTSTAYFQSPEDVSDFGDTFVRGYLEARTLAKAYGLRLVNVMERQMGRTSEDGRYCRGEFAVSPDGSVSVCHRVSDEGEAQRMNMGYGHVDSSGRVSIDSRRLLEAFAVPRLPNRCDGCLLRAECRGGCRVHNMTYGDDIQRAFCDLKRKFVDALRLRERKECHGE